MKKTVFILVFVLILLLSACASAPASFAYPSLQNNAANDNKMLGAEGAGAPAVDSTSGLVSPNVPDIAQDRIVIMNGSRTLVVNDPTDAARKIAAMAVAKGGWVVSSNINQSSYGTNGEKYYSGDITIRVPAESIDATLTEIEALAVEVITRQLSGQDVTSEYTDLQSRLRNMRASQERLLTFMQNAENTEARTAVEEQLRQVQGEIEVLEGQIRYYDESAQFSSISVSLEPFIPSQPIEIGGWHPEGVAKEALEDLLRGLQELVDIIIRLGICGLPVLIILALMAAPFILITRAILKRRKTQ